MVEDLNHIRTQRGQMDLTPDARILASAWYEEELGKPRDSRLEGYFGRKHDTMFKIAMLLSLAESDERWITVPHIQQALHILEANEGSLVKVMSVVTANETGDK